MGDAADEHMEAGEDEWARHLSGRCEDGCQYCADEALKEELEEREQENGR